MCGIVGLIDKSATSSELNDLGRTMMSVIDHRGPDNQGTWCNGPAFLGHNRLSIIDLSSASNQPMRRGNLWMTFNGEIYNYVELRSELESDGHVFTTTGDVEVAMAAFQQWGEAAVERFIGMWSLAIWDEQKHELFCSRDRFGIKPFHYISESGRLHFASEIKALKASPLFSGSINRDQVARGLYLGWMQHWQETYFTNVLALPAAHNMRWRDGEITTWSYATLATANESPLSFEEHSEQFRELFLDSIKLTSRRDVPMGVCLSGGLDSTSIACALAQNEDEHSIKTFTAYYTGKGDVDERPYINHVLDAYPQIDAYYTSPSDTDVAEALDKIVWMMDAPMPSSSYISQYFVMELAAKNDVKVVLDGQGSDEIMGGYMHSLYRVIADLLRSGKFASAAEEWNAHSKRQSYGLTKRASVFAKSALTAVRDESALYALEFERTSPWIMPQPASKTPLRLEMPQGSRLNAFLYNLIHVTLLPTLLHTEDLNSMAFSIESRVPFLDHRLVDLCFSMPNEHKVHRGETKRVLRSAMRGIVPDPVLDRRDKTGFITPGHIKWLRGDLSHLLEGAWSDLDDIVDSKKLRPILDQYFAGDNTHALFIWRLAMLRKFLRTHA